MTDDKDKYRGGALWQAFHQQFECEYKFRVNENSGWVCATIRKGCAATVRAERCPMKFTLAAVKHKSATREDRLSKIEARVARLERYM